MDKRAGRRLEQMARHRWLAYARQNWRLLLRASLIVGLWTLLGLVPALIVYGPFGRGVAIGSLATLTVGFLVWVVAEESGAIRAQHGAMGEQHTATALGRLRRHGWHVRNDVLFDRFNVDHVLVGPAGVVAVETKTTSGRWDFTAAQMDPLAHDALRQARAGARKIRLLLSSMAEVRVRPVLVCWGPDVVDLPNGSIIIDGVVVIIGRQASGALARALDGDHTLSPSAVDDVLEHIDTFMARRDRHERRQGRVTAVRRVGSRFPLQRSA